MALHGSTSANLSPILFKGNNRSLGVNVIIHQDQSASMDNVSLFYSTGIFIGELQQALLSKKIGDDVRYPNLYSYFGVYSRNPSSSFTITNSNGSLSINQTFMRGLSTKATTISSWTNNYFNNSTSHIANICTNIINNTTGGRLSGFGNEIGGGSPKSEDIHGNIWSIFTTPNAISTQLPGRYGSVIGSNVRKGSTTIVITNSNEQENAPIQMINQLVSVNSTGTQTRSINGTLGEISFRNYRIIGLNSYDLGNYDGILFYGFTTNLPYGLVKFGLNDTYTIQRSAIYPTITTQSSFSGSELNQIQPTVILQSNTNSVLYDGSVTLTWNSFNATDVLSSGGFGFTNINTLSGSIVINNLKEDTAYSITVGNSVGSATASVQVNVGDQSKLVPTVNLSSPTESPEGYVYVNLNGSVTLNWTSTNATSVSSFTGTGFSPTTVSGSTTISNVNSDRTYTITVSGPGGTVKSNEIKVLVNNPTVNLSSSIQNQISELDQTIEISNGKYLNSQYIFIGGYSRDAFSGLTLIRQKPIILFSDNKQDWKVFETTDDTLLTDITFGNGNYVAVGTNGKIIVSSDNFFTSQTISITSQTRVDFLSVEYGNGTFIAVGTEYNSTSQKYVLTQYHSTNGTTWTKPNVTYSGLSSPPDTRSGLNSFGFDESISDQRLKFINGNFYLVSSFNHILYYSSNGLNWITSYVPATSGIPYQAKGIFYNGSVYILTTSFTDNAIYTSIDGLNWTFRHTYALPTVTFATTYTNYIGNNIITVDSQISTDGGSTWSNNSINFGRAISDGTSIISIKNNTVLNIYNNSEILESFDGVNTNSIFNSIEYEVSNFFFDLNAPYIIGKYSKFNSIAFAVQQLVSPLPENQSVNTISERKFYKFVSSTFYSYLSKSYLEEFEYIINWNSSNATNVVSTSGDQFSTNFLNGSITVVIDRISILEFFPTSFSKNYSITVSGYNSRTSTSSIVVYLQGSLSSPTISLSSDKSSVGIGETFNLTWNSTNATSVSSVTGLGFTAGATSGSTLVTAGINSTYRISVSGPSGIATSNTIPITINNPTVTLSSNKTSTDLNSPVKLTWTSTNATTVSSSIGIGFTPTEASGELLVYPTTNSTYRISVSGPSGIATSNTIPITINSPTVFFASSQDTIIPLGGTLALSWISTNANAITSFSGTGFTPTQVSGFAIITNITENRIYSITVSGPSGSVTASINVTVNASSNLSVSSTQLHDTLSLATESRGGIFSIDKVFINNITDNRIGFSSCLAEFIADTV